MLGDYWIRYQPKWALEELPDIETSNNEDVGDVTSNTLILEHLIIRFVRLKYKMLHFITSRYIEIDNNYFFRSTSLTQTSFEIIQFLNQLLIKNLTYFLLNILSFVVVHPFIYNILKLI